jgi:glutathione synthase/RimK-type ligase-like ATP-grasp enzyme
VILAVTHDGDEDAVPVLEALARLGADVAVLDLADLPGRARLSLEYGGEAAATSTSSATSLRLANGREIQAREIEAVWWRRTRPFTLHPGLSPRDAGFSDRQTAEAVEGFFASLPARFVNDPWRDRVASHKPLQLATAAAVGLAVPATLVTNDPERARAFVTGLAGQPAIHKALHATPGDWRPTRLVDVGQLDRLDAVRLAPVILQAYVPGVDLRVLAVGDRLFAAEIDARASRSPEDFRQVFERCPVRPVDLPAEVANRLLEVQRRLGLRYGAFDLRRRDDGEHVFLEVNPSGLWRFIEERTGQPISQALAELLGSPPR